MILLSRRLRARVLSQRNQRFASGALDESRVIKRWALHTLFGCVVLWCGLMGNVLGRCATLRRSLQRTSVQLHQMWRTSHRATRMLTSTVSVALV